RRGRRDGGPDAGLPSRPAAPDARGADLHRDPGSPPDKPGAPRRQAPADGPPPARVRVLAASRRSAPPERAVSPSGVYSADRRRPTGAVERSVAMGWTRAAALPVSVLVGLLSLGATGAPGIGGPAIR